MPRNIRTWLHKTLSRHRTSSPDGLPPSLPFLPASRPRALTPASSQASLPLPTSAAARSPFFAALPPELRRAILIAAFGGRTLHITLEYAHPLGTTPPAPGSPSPRMRHGGVWFSGSQVLRDADKGPKAWRWRTCICHREPPPLWWSEGAEGGRRGYRR